MSIPVKVCVRVRPLSAKELREKSTDCVEYYSDNQIALNGKSFTFDRVFKPEVTQDEVYDACAAPLVDSLFKGFNASILAYGQTGSGKTFTMGTEDTDTMSSTSRGLIPRMVESIFTRIAATADPALFSVTVSMVEVYDEKVYDLLVKERGDPLDIKESSKGVYIKDLSHNPVKSLVDTMTLLEKGCGLRKKGSTAMNEQSSRSHAVFTVVMQKDDSEESTSFESKLSLVDLAGSERLKKTMAEGERKKEGIKINEGLLALGHVISALSDREKHVPYRNSSITRILQDSLGGNSFTVMVACASPAVSNGEETLSTLRYAYRTKSIKNKPIVNVDPATAALKQLQEENRNLKREILRLKGGRAATPPDSEDEPFASEVESEMEKKLQELQEMCHRHIQEKATLVSLHVHKEEMLESLNSKLEAAKQLIENKENDSDEIIEELRALLCSESGHNDSVNHSIIRDDEMEQEHSIEVVAQSVHTINGDVERLREMIDTRQKAVAEAVLQNEKFNEKFTESREEIKKLNNEISQLLDEKHSLTRKLREMTNGEKVNDGYRKRLKDLERESSALKQKLKECMKYESMKKESDKALARARSELENAKKMRVDMVKKLRNESAKYMRMKTQLDRATAQISRAERKREFEVAASTRKHEMQLNVMRRKLADAQAASKRLQKQFSKQKLNSKTRKNMDKDKDNLPVYIKGELDMAVSSWETRELLKELTQQRNKLESQMEKLRRKQKGEPTTKRRKTDISPSEQESLDEEIESLQNAINIRQKEIDVIQERFAEFEDVKPDERWAVCETVDLGNAALKNLFSLAEAARIDALLKTRKISALNGELKEAKEEIKRLGEDVDVLPLPLPSKREVRAPKHLMDGYRNTLQAVQISDVDESFEDPKDPRFETPGCLKLKSKKRHNTHTDEDCHSQLLSLEDDSERVPLGSMLNGPASGKKYVVKFPDI